MQLWVHLPSELTPEQQCVFGLHRREQPQFDGQGSPASMQIWKQPPVTWAAQHLPVEQRMEQPHTDA